MTSPGIDAETSTGITEQYKKFIGRKILFILSLLILIFLIAGLSASIGSANLPLRDTYAAFFHRFFPGYFNPSRFAVTCVWTIRLPRILLGVVAGIALGVAGCVMQSILRNPLASPYTLGISAGAGFGACLAIISGVGFVGGRYLIMGNAFIFALLTMFIIIGLSSCKGVTPETMILAGIALMYLFSAMTTLLQYFADPDAVKDVLFWMVGSLGRSSWSKLSLIAIVLACCVPLLVLKSWDLNVMSAGDEPAKSLGVNVERVRIFVLLIAALLTASVVCFTGTIGFVGLVAPHLCRMVIGGDNRFLIPASGLAGAALLVVADLVARTIIAPIIIPIGVMTAFMGVPLFLYLIMRRRKDYW